jgi:anaerobic selenocysteine-containing dehydrogenase
MRSVCPHDCPSACSLLVSVKDGRLAEVTGDPAQPFTQGVICGKVRAYAERVHSPLRVLTPLRRTGSKGGGGFERITWGEALGEIAARWRAIIADEGAEAILPFSYAGTMGQVQYYAGHPLFHALGASLLDRTICVSTAYAGWCATLGAATGNDSNRFFLNSSFSESERLRRRQRTASVLMSPVDAEARGIAEGNEVRLVSGRGEARFRARIDGDARLGVVASLPTWRAQRQHAHERSSG